VIIRLEIELMWCGFQEHLPEIFTIKLTPLPREHRGGVKPALNAVVVVEAGIEIGADDYSLTPNGLG
jgi:hypothetical protein